jgi:hypothetical protein
VQTSRPILILCAILSSSALHAQSADAVQKRLEAEAVKLRGWTADKPLVAAINAQNAQHLTAAEIQRRDKAWTDGTDKALPQSVTTGPCANRLRELGGKSSMYGEILVMDNQGALVCATNPPSDYWQGDEPKWTRTFAGGKGAVFVDRPRRDESAKESLAQVSLPVMESGRVIGAITIGIRLDQLTAK